MANAARVSFAKHSNKFTTRAEKPKGSDEGILDFLAREHHWTPFSHVRYTFSSGRPLVDINKLDETLLAGMVFKNGFKTVRHSAYGWIQLWKKGALLEPRITSFFVEAMPYTAHSFGLLGGTEPYFPIHIDDDPRFIDITMREKVPIFIARQRFKHMIGFTYNEVSRRYVDEEPEFYVPEFWRERAKNKKQGSGGNHEGYVYYEWEEDDSRIPYEFQAGVDITMEEVYTNLIQDTSRDYKAAIFSKIAPEQARMVLPQSMMTEYYVTGSLAAWKRAYALRKPEDAQKEIRDLADLWDQTILQTEHKELWEKIKNE